MTPDLAARTRPTRRAAVARRGDAVAAGAALLPFVALAYASLESAVVYAAGQLLKTIGAQ